ncbi:MAG: hypothetical protein ABEJ36_03645 [Candidatus Nanosalina sp.]
MKQRVREYLQDTEKPQSTNAIAEALDADWHTENDAQEELEEAGEAHRSEMSDRLTLWWDRPIPM